MKARSGMGRPLARGWDPRPCHCEQSEAIQGTSSGAVWIASSPSLTSGRATRGPVGSSQWRFLVSIAHEKGPGRDRGLIDLAKW